MMATLRKTAGILLVVGVTQFVFALVIGESIYPGYHVGRQVISDLGVGPTAVLFDASVFLMGLATLVAAVLIFLSTRALVFSVLLAITGLSAAGVGVFPETAGFIHVAFAASTFAFGAFAAIAA